MAAAWCSTPCAMGIDEAGRGPVLGPMVYGCAYCAVAYKEELASLKFAGMRFQDIDRGKTRKAFRELEGGPIDGVKRSLNDISYDSAIGLIKLVLSRGVLLSEVYVDTVGDAEKYQARLSELFPHIKFTVAKKADSLFPIVSAASIAAKVTRDQALKSWVMDEAGCAISRNFGSGYPGDPETKAWLEQHMDDVFGFPSLVRFSWATCKPLIAEGGVHVYWEADEDDDTALVKKSRSAQTESSGALRHSFFRSRQLQQVTTRL
ncbi:hypothetical protein SELMODRAFT_233940 [Selaginella moellendorffii]|uniref:Ribonuclease n=1 Tax=Selaginella moellendorffii TaxID=88036 RepID=D8SFY2_SELML|nr:hypothetical protein SELMODRAFT_233940 [Selaginella moellendorffii]